MPEVPYNNTQVAQDAGPNVRVQNTPGVESFGGGGVSAVAAQGFREMNSEVQNIAERSYKAANAAYKMKKQNDFNTVHDHSVYGFTDETGTVQPGLLQKLTGAGKDAHGVYDGFKSQYQQLVNKQINDAQDDYQKSMITDMAIDTLNNIDKVAQPKIQAEMQRYEKDTRDGLTDSAQSLSAKAYAHDDIVEQNAQKIATAHDEYMATHGKDEKAEYEKQKEISKNYQMAVEGYLNSGQDVAAKAYFEKVGDKIKDGKIYGDLQKAVHQGALNGEAQRIATGLSDKYSDMNAASEEIGKIGDQKLQDEVRQRTRYEIDQKNKQTEVAHSNDVLNAHQIAVQSGNYDSIPPAIQTKLKASESDAIKKIVANSNGTVPIKNDSSVYNEYSLMPAGKLGKLTPSQMITDVYPHLDNYHQGLIKDQWLNAQAGVGGDQAKLDSANQLSTNNQVILDSIRNARIAGMKPTDTIQHIDSTPKTKVAFDRQRQAIQQEIDTQQKLKGKPLTRDEVKAAADKINAQTVFVEEPAWFGRTNQVDKNLYQLSPEERQNFKIHIDTIPDQDKQQLLELGIQSGNISPSMRDNPQLAYSKYKYSFEKAAAAALRGADRDQIRAIMGEK